MSETAKTTRVVKVLGFTYVKKRENPYDPGKDLYEHAFAQRGEEIEWDDLSPVDKERTDRLEVFYSPEEQERVEEGLPAAEPEEPTAGEGTEIVLDENSSVETLATWIKDDEPTVNELLEFVEGDAEVARKVLEAENIATKNDPRKTLVEGLSKVIGQA